MNAQTKIQPATHTPGYNVTPDGRVFSLIPWRGQATRELCQDLNADGYPSVRIIINGKRTRIAVHRLVARVYLPPRPTVHHELRHLDGNRKNSNSLNLAWGTQQDNADDRERHGRTSRGTRHSEFIKAGLARVAKATGGA